MAVIREVHRTWFAFALLVVMLVALAFAPPMKSSFQLLIYKVVLANAGFLNGHIVRKLAFPPAGWRTEGYTLLKVLAIVIYGMFIYVYSQGG